MARRETLIFLNPDAVPEPGALELLAARARRDRRAVFGPELLAADDSIRFLCRKRSLLRHEVSDLIPGLHRVATSGWRRDLPPDSPVYEAGGSVAYLQGACIAIDRQTFVSLGGFDEDFFLYGEEEGLCARVRAYGGEAIYEPRARVRHISGTSSARAESPTARRLAVFHRFRSRIVLFRKSRGSLGGLLAAIVIVPALLVQSAAGLALGSGFRQRRGLEKGYLRLAIRGLLAGLRADLEHPDLCWIGRPGALGSGVTRGSTVS
jgi:N-acetylglucosaminyl-diphospho-decaprenol L-rhamnosyltransferase